MLADDLKQKNQALQQEIGSLKGGSAPQGDLKAENAQLRKALAQRGQLLRSWQKHLNQVLGPLDVEEKG